MWQEIKPTGIKILKTEPGERLLFSHLAVNKRRMIMIISAATCTAPRMFVATYWCNNILLICPNPSLTPGRPDLQREEKPAERIPQPPPGPRTGGQCWAGRQSDPPIRETSCCQSGCVDDLAASKLPPQHHQAHQSSPPTGGAAEGPGPPHLSGTCICSWATDTVTSAWRTGSSQVPPDVSARDSWSGSSSQSSGEPSAWTKVNSSISFSMSNPLYSLTWRKLMEAPPRGGFCLWISVWNCAIYTYLPEGVLGVQDGKTTWHYNV